MVEFIRLDILIGTLVLGSMFSVMTYALWRGWQVFRSAKLEFQNADERFRNKICDLFESSEEAIWVCPPFLENRMRFQKLPFDNSYMYVAEIDGVTLYVPRKSLLRALKNREHSRT